MTQENSEKIEIEEVKEAVLKSIKTASEKMFDGYSESALQLSQTYCNLVNAQHLEAQLKK